MKTLRECKSEAAKKNGYIDFEFVPYHLFEEYSDRAAELYAAQFREPSTEQSGLNEVYNLLAVLHGDGGNYREKHGLVKAANDAQELLHTKWIIKESEQSGGTEHEQNIIIEDLMNEFASDWVHKFDEIPDIYSEIRAKFIITRKPLDR